MPVARATSTGHVYGLDCASEPLAAAEAAAVSLPKASQDGQTVQQLKENDATGHLSCHLLMQPKMDGVGDDAFKDMPPALATTLAPSIPAAPSFTSSSGVDMPGDICGSSGTRHSTARNNSSGPLNRPVRPAQDAQTAQQMQQQQQQQSSSGRLLTWRNNSKKKAPQLLDNGAPATSAAAASAADRQQLMQQTQQTLMPLAPSVDDNGSLFVTSPVSVVSSTTPTRWLACSISNAFAVHQHQLMFSVGPHALAVSIKALATARNMLALPNPSTAITSSCLEKSSASSAKNTKRAGRSSPGVESEVASRTFETAAEVQQQHQRRRRQQQQQQHEPAEKAMPCNLLMQPTLRGRSRSGCYSYALDVSRVDQLPLNPAGGSRDRGVQAANANFVHITSCSNEQVAARNLVENMPGRGQTVIRVAGPYATETAVLAVALARPMMLKRWGQDLAVCVLWGENKAYKGKQTGLLLSVFRCDAGSFPPQVVLMPPSARTTRRAAFWERQKQQKLPAVQRPGVLRSQQPTNSTGPEVGHPSS
jgi:stage V sporulation protein SpoVS